MGRPVSTTDYHADGVRYSADKLQFMRVDYIMEVLCIGRKPAERLIKAEAARRGWVMVRGRFNQRVWEPAAPVAGEP